MFWVDRSSSSPLVSLPCHFTMKERCMKKTIFPKNFQYVLRTTRTPAPHGKFHRFVVPFSSKFSDRNFALYVLFNLPVLHVCHVSRTVSLGYLWFLATARGFEAHKVCHINQTKYCATPPTQQIFLPPRFWVLMWPAATRGRVPFDQNFRKSRFKIEWNRHFPEIRFENFGSPLEVVLFSGNLEILQISCSIWHFYPA